MRRKAPAPTGDKSVGREPYEQIWVVLQRVAPANILVLLVWSIGAFLMVEITTACQSKEEVILGASPGEDTERPPAVHYQDGVQRRGTHHSVAAHTGYDQRHLRQSFEG